MIYDTFQSVPSARFGKEEWHCPDIRAQVLMLRATLALSPTLYTLSWAFEKIDFSIDGRTPRSVFLVHEFLIS
jgi:hypothetical protein